MKNIIEELKKKDTYKNPILNRPGLLIRPKSQIFPTENRTSAENFGSDGRTDGRKPKPKISSSDEIFSSAENISSAEKGSSAEICSSTEKILDTCSKN